MNSKDKNIFETYTRINDLINEFDLPADYVITMIWQRQGMGKARRDNFYNWNMQFTVEEYNKLRLHFGVIHRINNLIFKNEKPTAWFIKACNVLLIQDWFEITQFYDRLNTSNPYVDELRSVSFQSAERVYQSFAQIYNHRSRNNRIIESRKEAKKRTI